MPAIPGNERLRRVRYYLPDGRVWWETMFDGISGDIPSPPMMPRGLTLRQEVEVVSRSAIPNDGGPAFPGVVIPDDATDEFRGMSLRDWFAGQALIGILQETGEDIPGYRGDKGTAKACYEIADAMISFRSQPKEQPNGSEETRPQETPTEAQAGLP